jgi:WavE lipopolysaccharide synthesis
MKFDVVLQGPVSDVLPAVIAEYQKEEWIDKIIISTWIGESVAIPNVLVLFNEDDVSPGVGNRNRQIKSSREGLKFVSSPFAIKARTDQIIQDLPMMKRFFDKYFVGDNLFTLGLYKAFPFHPRDHFFMGATENLRILFDVEYDTYAGPVDYTKHLRSEAWIGSKYFSRFSEDAKYMRDHFLEFLVDEAPRLNEALKLDIVLKPRLFTPFPRIRLAWPKHALKIYHYDIGELHTEYWNEDFKE